MPKASKKKGKAKAVGSIKCPGCGEKVLLPMSPSLRTVSFLCTCGWRWEGGVWRNINKLVNWSEIKDG